MLKAADHLKLYIVTIVICQSARLDWAGSGDRPRGTTREQWRVPIEPRFTAKVKFFGRQTGATAMRPTEAMGPKARTAKARQHLNVAPSLSAAMKSGPRSADAAEWSRCLPLRGRQRQRPETDKAPHVRTARLRPADAQST